MGSGWHSSKRLRYTTPTTPPPPREKRKKKGGGKGAVFTHHLAVVQGSLGFVGAFGAAAPALPIPALQRRLADLEDRGAGGPAGALFAPIRCRTHAYTSTKPKPLVQCAPARAARWLPLHAAAEQPEPRPRGARGSQGCGWLRGWVTFSLKESRGSAACAVQHRFH